MEGPTWSITDWASRAGWGPPHHGRQKQIGKPGAGDVASPERGPDLDSCAPRPPRLRNDLLVSRLVLCTRRDFRSLSDGAGFAFVREPSVPPDRGECST